MASSLSVSAWTISLSVCAWSTAWTISLSVSAWTISLSVLGQCHYLSVLGQYHYLSVRGQYKQEVWRFGVFPIWLQSGLPWSGMGEMHPCLTWVIPHVWSFTYYCIYWGSYSKFVVIIVHIANESNEHYIKTFTSKSFEVCNILLSQKEASSNVWHCHLLHAV